MKRKHPAPSETGHTLIEVLIVLVIFTTFTLFAFELVRVTQIAQVRQDRKLLGLQAVRAPFYQTLDALRLAGYPAANNFTTANPLAVSDGFVEVSPTVVAFEVDLDRDGVVEKIEYRLSADGRTLGHRIFPKTGAGAWGAATTVNDPFIQNIANADQTPALDLFQWETDPDSLLAFPGNVTVVYVNLAIEVSLDPDNPGLTQIITLTGAARQVNPKQ